MTKQDSLTLLTRAGFLARALLYLAMAWLVLGAGRAEGAQGVLSYLGSGVGMWLLVAMGLGFAGYGLWRLSDAALGTEHPGSGHKAIAMRAGAGASALVHLFLAWQSIQLARGASGASASTNETAQDVLQLPAGGLILAAAAAVLLIAGGAQLVIAGKCSFLDHLEDSVRDSWVKWLGRLGFAARGAVFLIAGYYVLTAAIDGDSSRAGGTEQVLEWLSHPIDRIIAAGLFLFGIYGLVEARYRRIHPPDVDGLAARARGQMPV